MKDIAPLESDERFPSFPHYFLCFRSFKVNFFALHNDNPSIKLNDSFEVNVYRAQIRFRHVSNFMGCSVLDREPASIVPLGYWNYCVSSDASFTIYNVNHKYQNDSSNLWTVILLPVKEFAMISRKSGKKVLWKLR